MSSRDTSSTPTGATGKAAPERAPVSIFLATADAGGLVAAGPYTPGKRHDGVPADLADRLAARYQFKIVPADFVPPTPAATPAPKEG